MTAHNETTPAHATIARSGLSPMSAAGDTIVIREWTDSGPSYLHIHHSDDEAWHVLEGSLRFRFAGGEVDAPAGTTVFVPAGVAHTYRVTEPSRYLIFLTPKLDRLIAKLRAMTSRSELSATLAAFDTVMVDEDK
jgi:mannose-6-phosphate isomerase-like protein (cupin superfamily)